MYEVARGETITLPCTFKTFQTNPKSITIIWSTQAVQANAEETDILTNYYLINTTDIDTNYEGRVSIDVDIKTGKADLKLSSVTLEDNKNFKCQVQIPSDNKGRPQYVTRLVVLVAPSPPICKIQGKAEYGQNINLTCVSEEGSPPPTYKWDPRDVKNMPRVPDRRTTDKDGILSLYNISKDTSGFYICTSTNKIRSASCNLTLSVMPPSMNIGSTAGIIGGVVAALILLIIIIYCCCCKKKKQNEEYVMGVRDQNGESRHPDGQENTPKNVDSSAKVPNEQRDQYKEKSERESDKRTDYDDLRTDSNDRRRDYDDRRRDYDDRRSDYNDRRSDYDDRRSDYNDRRSDYDDRRSDYNDRRSDYDDRRSDYNDRRSDYDDRRERYDDNRHYDDRRDRHYNDRDRP
ncbi:cell surface A33 antigen-like [Xenentodon cancila]